jgi:hypothetical protein
MKNNHKNGDNSTKQQQASETRHDLGLGARSRFLAYGNDHLYKGLEHVAIPSRISEAQREINECADEYIRLRAKRLNPSACCAASPLGTSRRRAPASSE